MTQSTIIAVTDPSAAGEARRRAVAMASSFGWPPEDSGRLAIGVTEAATNLVKHATMGEIHLRACGTGYGDGIEMIASDRGPGMHRVQDFLRDGFSTKGTSGEGLGAIERLATEFDICSVPGKGTVMVARFYRSSSVVPSLRVGSIQSPIRGEDVCGDSWGVRFEDGAAVILLADGLGHGIGAATASRKAVEILMGSVVTRPLALLELVHGALRGTRGAAVAIARIDFAAASISFAGVGNISAVLSRDDTVQHLISPSGTAGDMVRKMQEYVYPWTPYSRLLMHSDGLTTSWKLSEYAHLIGKDPALIAASLFREARRERDDACVVVAQERK